MKAVLPSRSHRCIAGAIALFSLLLLFVSPAFALDFPALTGRVVDQAGIIPANQAISLDTSLKALEDKSSDQLVVVTLKSLEGREIADYGYQLGRHWGIGQGRLSNGVLLIVAPNERKVRIEVGYGLEGTLTDALSSVIINQAILPAFKTGDMPAGIKAGAAAIADVLLDNESEWKQRAKAGAGVEIPFLRSDAVFYLLFFSVPMAFFALFIGFIRLFAIDTPGLPAGTSSGSGWSSSSSSSSSSSGGFSGGGGSFGGGGASGSW